MDDKRGSPTFRMDCNRTRYSVSLQLLYFQDSLQSESEGNELCWNGVVGIGIGESEMQMAQGPPFPHR